MKKYETKETHAFTPPGVIVEALRRLRGLVVARFCEPVDYEADPLANPSAFSKEEVAAAHARYVCARCGGLLDALRICPECAASDGVVPWGGVPDRALVVVEADGRQDYFYRAGLVGWWVGGGPDLRGKIEFCGLPPTGNCWPEWTFWEAELCRRRPQPSLQARVIGLDLAGDECAARIRRMARPAMTMLEAVAHCVETGDVMRPQGYPRGYYFFISPQTGPRVKRICSPGLSGAVPAEISVSAMLGRWETLTAAAAEAERAEWWNQ